MKVLSNALRDVDDILPHRDLNVQQRTDFFEIAHTCDNILKELEKKLDTFQVLEASANGISGKSRRVWKRLRWEQKDIDQFRSRITLNISAFNTFLGRVNR